MLITLASPDTIRLDFPYSQRTVEAVKSLLGSEYDKDAKTWTTRLCHLRRLATMFPAAQIDPAAIEARIAQWGRVVADYNTLGVWFCYDVDGETVTATGRGVSPAFLAWCAAHTGQIAPWLGEQVAPTAIEASSPVTVEPNDGDKRLWIGIQGGVKADAKKAAIVERRGKERRGAKQMELQL